MFELIPKRTNSVARRLILLFFLGAAAMILITMLAPAIPFRWVFQLISLGLLTAGIFLTTRYVTKLFIYRVEEDREGGLDLTVTEAASNGRRQVTVCRVGLSSILRRTHVESAAEAERLLSELRKQRTKVFDYTVDFHPTESILLVVREGGEELALRLSYDKALFDLLPPSEAEPREEN